MPDPEVTVRMAIDASVAARAQKVANGELIYDDGTEVNVKCWPWRRPLPPHLVEIVPSRAGGGLVLKFADPDKLSDAALVARKKTAAA